MSGDASAAERPALHGRPSARELALLIAIVALAAILRLPNLDQRGAWDADQGTDMLVLQGLVDRGEVPLLGPKTSIGTFHHGAVYYYLLAPAAFLSGVDPVAVMGEIALFGLGAVVATWWLARLIAGPVAGLAAGLLMAVSPAGIEASTFIWNPNLIPFASAVAFAAALHAVRSRHARWWLLSAVGAMVVMQCHVLGVVVVPPLVVAWLADVRGRRRRGERLGPAAGAGAGAVAIIAAGYLPLLAFELGHDFAETRAILGYLAGGGSGAASGVLGRIGIVGLRSLSWPVAGLLTERPLLALLAVLAACGLAGVAVVRARGAARRAAAWLVGSVGWAIVALALFAPSLAVVTPGLPNDHYHSFLDPLVLALIGSGLALSAGVGAERARSSVARPLLAAGTGILLVAVSVMALAAVPVARRWLAAGRPGRGPDDQGRRVRPARARRHPAVQERQRAPVPARASWCGAAGGRGLGLPHRPERPARDRLRPAVRRRRRCRLRRPGRGRLRRGPHGGPGARRSLRRRGQARYLGVPHAVAPRLKCERRPLQTGVRCPRDPNVEGRSGRALEVFYGRPCRLGGRAGGRCTP